MIDPRMEKLAGVLVEYSTSVEAGDLVRIAGPPVAAPLLASLYRAALTAGAHPYVNITPDECAELLLKHGSDNQLAFENPVLQFEAEQADVLISVWAQDNTRALTNVDPARQAIRSQARKKFLDTVLRRAADQELRWVGTQFPCQSSAQDAEMSLTEYEDFVYRAGQLHLKDPVAAWREMSARQQRLADYLSAAQEIRFTAPNGTDLRLGVAGRSWINCDGHENFPDGEVFTGPIETATDGVVQFSFPAVHAGREVDGVRLVFENGRVVDAAANKGEAFLHAMLDQDDGARVLGEIAIGTNYGITSYTRNTLFDEKIGGTFHAALGAAYPESGGLNKSGLHWDMVCDLRQGGKIYVDRKLISENGRFLDASWPRA